MIAYFDTSAIAKYFHTESGSVEVIKIIDSPDNTVWISELAVTELLSAFHRKLRLGEISLETLQNLITAFESKAAVWNIEPFSTLQTEEANRIIYTYGKTISIRTLDALHLAAFNLLKQNEWVFVVADKQLSNVASTAGIKILFIQ